MILLITGGRDYGDVGAVFDTLVILQKTFDIDFLVHGGAPGADILADKVAKELGIDRIVFPANWKKYNKGAAGPIRNRNMIEMIPVDLVVAFPGGNGTANMKKQAAKKGIIVVDAIDILKEEKNNVI